MKFLGASNTGKLLRLLVCSKFFCALLASACLSLPLYAQQFEVADIDLRGAERISLATVRSYLPISLGQTVDDEAIGEAIRALFATGFFSDIQMSQQGTTLVIQVTERPAIAEVNIEGNNKVKTEDINEAFEDSNLTRGQIFNESVLDNIEQELQRLYNSLGKYGVKVEVDVQPLPRNRVRININIREGLTAKIRQVNIVGNEAFSDDRLLDQFESGIPAWWALFSSRDEYARTKLTGDLEKLRSYYLDRGYLNFDIDSTQVTISPDKKDIFITINIDEGEVYTIRDINIAGQLIVPESQIEALVNAAVRPGDVFSRKQVIQADDFVSKRLGNEGYANATANVIPQVDEATNEVDLTFNVVPGKRVYVRRISFEGNERTYDEVYRREMRQLEGSWYAANKVERSRVRLQRLSYVEEVEVENQPVAGTDNQIDLVFTVRERPSGSFNIGAGVSGDDGIALTLGLTQNNLFGSGNTISMNINTNDVVESYNLTYTEPYYTNDGVSRSVNLFFREVDTSGTLLSDFTINTWGGNLTYGIPLTEYSRLRFGIGSENTEVVPGSNPFVEIRNFVDEFPGEQNNFVVNAAYIYDTRNRTVFATRGSRQLLTYELAIPGSDLQYYKASYVSDYYIPVTAATSVLVNLDIAVGDGIDNVEELPFYEKFSSGGVRSLRGFEARSIGPRGTDLLNPNNRDTLGGDFKTVGSVEYIFPPPGGSGAARFSFFYDFGNVYRNYNDFELNEFRTSVGVSLRWLTPIGGLVFNYAEPLQFEDIDETERFQFTIGGNF